MSDFKSDLVNFFDRNDPKHLNKVSRIAEMFRTPAKQAIVMEHLHDKYNVPYNGPVIEAAPKAVPEAETSEMADTNEAQETAVMNEASEAEDVTASHDTTEDASAAKNETVEAEAGDTEASSEEAPVEEGKKKKRGLFGRRK